MIRTLLRLVPAERRGGVRRYTALIAGVVVTRAAACVLLLPLLARLFSDTPRDAWPWVLVFVGTLAVHGALDHRLGRAGFALGLDVMEHVQHQLVDRLAEVPLGWLSGARRPGAQRAITTSGQEVAQTIGNLVTPFVLAVTLPLAIAVGLLFVAWPLGVAALIAAPLLLVSRTAAERCSRRADTRFDEAITELDDRILEFARAQTTLRAARRADPDQSAAGEALASEHVATVSLLRWSVPGQLLFSVASQLALLALAITALALVRHGDVTIPEALALIVIAVRFLEPFTTLSELTPALAAIGTTLRRIDEVLHTPTLRAELTAPTDATTHADRAPEVRLEVVRFRHTGAAATTIDGIDLVAPAGATTAIVGPSGAGKSTLLALIARFYDVDEGRVLLDGADVRSMSPEDLYAGMSFVFQNVYLFDGTIRDNVLVGDTSADDAALDEVARLARVDEIVGRLPAGWDTPVGEGGVALSGGERQRVGIARALLKRARLLLVDEATSSLDSENEHAIAAALMAGSGARTTIIVAHRMRTIEQADHIVFVDGGRVVEAGPRDELLARGGRFAAFHDDQRASGRWTIGRSADR